MRFLEPGFLLLLLLVPAVWFFPRRATDRVHAAIRTAVLVFLTFALAQPVAYTAVGEAHHAFVLDRSASVSDARQSAALDAVSAMARSLPDADRTTLVVMGEAPGAVDGIDRIVAVSEPGSPLSRALAVAADALPAGAAGQVTVLSDGQATDHDWAVPVLALESRGVPVHTVRLPHDIVDVRPVGLSAEGRLRVGHTALLRVDVVGTATGVTVRIEAGGRTLVERTGIDVDGRTSVALEIEPESAGFLTLTAAVEAPAAAADAVVNDRLSRTFAVQDPIRVAYLGQRVVGAAEQLGALVGPGFDIRTPDLTGDLTGDPGEILSQADVVVLDDRPTASVPDPFQQALAKAVVEDGLGLLVAGGRAAFGAGGWHESRLAALLPVELVHREEKRDPSTTLVVIIDTSGSMSGGRVQLAKEVARLAIRRLLPHDKVGVVEFYGAKRWAAPIQPASNSIEIERALNRLNAGGGTIILPAIVEAFYGMQNVQTRYKHVLVLTDGGVEAGSFEPLLRRMAEKGMNVSTVLVGSQLHSEFLVNLANWGKGRFYSVPNRFNLPEVILKQPASARLPAYRPGTHPVSPRGGSRWWGGALPDDVPPLAGYVETRARTGAQTLLALQEADQPILSTWRYGLGRVTALMTEPTGPGTEPWESWDGFGSLLARVLTRTAADDPGPFQLVLERRGAEVVLTATRTVRAPVQPDARLLGDDPSDVGTPLVFRVRADGVFTAHIPAAPSTEVRVVAGALGAPTHERLVENAADGGVLEHHVDPATALDLERLATATGGAIVAPSDAADWTPAAGRASRPVGLFKVWPIFALLALAAYLFDVFWRRRDRRSGETA